MADPLDLDALEALVAARHLPDACSDCDRYAETAARALPALVARVRALEAEVARLTGLLRQARRPVRQWVAEYSRDAADDLLLAAIEGLPPA